MEKIRVVLADDHALVRIGICNALSRIPSVEIVGEAVNGQTLFEVLAKTNPDLLLIDVVMPDFEPLPAIRQIRIDYPTMRILVVSAFDDKAYVEGLLQAGVDGYHLKDDSLSDLELAIERVLAGQRWISSSLIGRLVTGSEHGVSPIVLTSRQVAVLQLLQKGLDNKSIARRLGLSVKTIENHLTRLYRALNVQSRIEAVNYAFQHSDTLGVSRKPEATDQLRGETAIADGVTILLVDDNPRYRRQLSLMIGGICPGAKVLEANDSVEALYAAQRAQPHLVFLDVILGEENGIHYVRRLAELLPTAQILLISAYPDREFHRLGLEAGAVAFVDKKDLDMIALRQILDNMTV